MYYKYPSETFVKSVRIENEIANDDEEAHNVSPRCHTLCTQANANMQKKANSITEKIMKNSPSLIFNVGDVVLVPLDAVNCTKVDGGNQQGKINLPGSSAARITSPCICLPCLEASSGIFKQYRCDEFEGSI